MLINFIQTPLLKCCSHIRFINLSCRLRVHASILTSFDWTLQRMDNRCLRCNYQFPANFWTLYQMQAFREAQRSSKLHYYCFFRLVRHETRVRWLFPERSARAKQRRLTQGSPILLYLSPWRQAVPSGSEFATQRKALFKERHVWLIVLFLSGSPCSLESPWTKQPERKCAECNEAGASFLSFSVHPPIPLCKRPAAMDRRFILIPAA